MEKTLNDKGFSLVELIIVMAIMAVLIGVLAPIYLRYVDTTKRTTDCSSLGSVMDACEVLAADPEVDWVSGDEGKITIIFDTNREGHETSYTTTGSGPVDALEELADSDKVSVTADWGPFTIDAVRDDSGHVEFSIQDETQIAELSAYSTALSQRLE